LQSLCARLRYQTGSDSCAIFDSDDREVPRCKGTIGGK
jgi:hypothetical protein